MDPYRKNNQALWNEWTRINAASTMYQLDEFIAGENKLNPLEISEVGPVAGRSLLHLQCHFGMDTLSWARLGANVTGVDFSDEAIRLAQKLSQQTGLPGRFICCDLYDLPQHLTETFDIVYTSYGVLSWLPDLPNWAKLVARYLKPGGIFYIAEFHPLSMMLDETAEQPVLRYPYFKEGPVEFAVQGSYADPTAECAVKTEYDWFYTLEGVITSLLAAGLKLEFVHEFPYTVYPQLPYLVHGEDGYWRMPPHQPALPLLFSIRAQK